MARSKTSAKWLKEHFSDVYVKRAQQEGFRARSVYKLKEIQERYKFIKPGMTVVDLGAAPGAWSEYVKTLVGAKGKIIALDILSMNPIVDVDFIQGDFSDVEIVKALIEKVGERKVDVVLSDMAPNMSGISSVDQDRSMFLVEMAAAFAMKVLKPEGIFLTKVFHGVGFDALVKLVKSHFKKVNTVKPDASRSRSKEVYLFAQGFQVQL